VYIITQKSVDYPTNNPLQIRFYKSASFVILIKLTTEILITSLILILLGLGVMFYGYKLFRLLLIAGGFGLGVIIAQQLYQGEPQAKLLVSLVVGLVLAVLANIVYSIGFVLIAAALSSALMYLIITQFGQLDMVSLLLIAGAGIAGAIITMTFKLEKLIVVVSCCVYGFLLVGQGILRLIYSGNTPALKELPIITILVLVVLGSILLGLGATNQLRKQE